MSECLISGRILDNILAYIGLLFIYITLDKVLLVPLANLLNE